jgi:hypothetical protein
LRQSQATQTATIAEMRAFVEVHDALSKERHICARRRIGERPVSWPVDTSELSLSSSPHGGEGKGEGGKERWS